MHVLGESLQIGCLILYWASLVAQSVKNPPAMQETACSTGDPGEGNGTPLQYYCLGNSMDRRAWWATVHAVTKSQTRLKHAHTHIPTTDPLCAIYWGFSGGASGKELACQCRRRQRCGFNPGLGRSPGGGHGSPLQCSCSKNPMSQEVWWVTVHTVTESQTRLAKPWSVS